MGYGPVPLEEPVAFRERKGCSVSSSFIERERKFDVRPDFEVPDLAAVIPPGSELRRSVQQLRSDYFDTADHALRRVGITFRRRSGTDDTGWHLKLPHGEHREELHADLSDEQPVELTRLLIGITRGAVLSRVATLETERHVTRIVELDGDVVADIDLDHVTATTESATGTSVSTWTELEIELGSPSVSDEQLTVLARRVRDAGARPAQSTSKLARALDSTPTIPKRTKQKQRKHARAGEVLLPYLVEQQHTLLLGDIALRRGDDDVIHRTRVATRRLRSALRVFAPFFDHDRRTLLDGQLRRYAEILGAVRDDQVLERRLDAAVRDLDPALVLGPVQHRIDAHLEARRRVDRERLQAELDGPRYLGLLRDLTSWIDAPPFTDAASRPEAALVRLARKADKKVAARLRAGNASGDLEVLHSARKSAKRARYAAEATRPITGKKARREAERFQHLQDLLGEHQDSVVAAELLLELGAAAGATAGENGFTFGLLHQREQDRAEEARRKARKAARRFA